MNKKNERGIAIAVIIVFVLLINGVAAFSQYGSSTSFSGGASSASFVNPGAYTSDFRSYYGSMADTYWPKLYERENQTCEGRQDLMLYIPPGGCQPNVVRSDLLAEQNVPVFCQVSAIEINPLIDVKKINGMSFRKNYPKEVSNVGFHPARAALRTSYNKLLGDPVINDIGYVVVMLKRNENESSLSDLVNLTLGVSLRYESGNIYGIGRSEFLLSEVSDEEWEQEKFKQSFWQGRYFLRLERMDNNYAYLSIYKGDRRVSSIRVERGKTSREIYLPGLYCRAGLQAQYINFEDSTTRAIVEIGDDDGTDKIMVTKGAEILDGACNIRDIRIDNRSKNYGNISIYCRGGEKIMLELKPRYYEMFNVFYTEGDFVEPVKDGDGYYYVNLGKNGIFKYQNGQLLCGKEKDDEIVFSLEECKKYRSDKEKERLTKIEHGLKEYEKLANSIDWNGELLFDKQYENATEYAFNEMMKAYEDIVDSYPYVKNSINRSFGERGLIDIISFFDKKVIDKPETEARIIKKFLELYPDSDMAEVYEKRLENIRKYDMSASGDIVYVANKYRTIRLVGLEDPEKKANAEFVFDVNPGKFVWNVGERKEIPSYSDKTDKDGKLLSYGDLKLERVDEERASIAYYCLKEIKNGAPVYENVQKSVLRVGESKSICQGVVVKLDNTNPEKVARIRLIPRAKGTESYVNLSVGIGIEKRMIKLSPDKTLDKIENLNESIKKWESIASGLGNVVRGLKGACFATSAILIGKNFLTSLSGEGLARQAVMKGENGWTAKCQDMVNDGDAATLNDCYLANAGKINEDVKARVDAINEVNTNIRSIEQGLEKGVGVFGGKSVDISEAKRDYANYIREKYKGKQIILPDGKVKNVEEIIMEVSDDREIAATYDQLREIDLSMILMERGSDTQKEIAKESMSDVASQIITTNDYMEEYNKAMNLKNHGYAMAVSMNAANRGIILADVVKADSGKIGNVVFDDTNMTHSATIAVSDYSKGKTQFDGGSYILGLEKTLDGKFVVREAVRVDNSGNVVRKIEKEDMAKFNSAYKIGNIVAISSISYNNKYKNPKVRYFENAPFKGMPAIVPFDTLRGWYAATKQTLPIFGQTGSFESSGRVSSYWLCNVGEDGMEQFNEGLGDDICQLINMNTGQPLGVFPGLNENEAKKLVGQGVNALMQAAEQYGKKTVRIGGQMYEVGRPALNMPSAQCQDFMDPKDCYVLFNVCDPVICPSSRCDLGGKYPVADVVQTGIIGSTLLCLPNVREKIIMPVCLTGIHAGVDSYISILRNHRDCLEESLESGRMIGICDQIYSIYACEFFWRQAAPISKMLLPKIIEWAYTGGGKVRGGGEYLTVQGAWQNMQNSINYFKNTYAVNSLKAFQIRSIEEAGGTFCKAFVSAKAPSAFESLIEPDSPPQFHAWFSSIIHSDATIPATAQYKVFYHIYAGRDSGVYYRVYLKSPDESSYYYMPYSVNVASGFIGGGEYRSETKDFTAPAGFKELCVNINGEEECGFKQVSSSFAVNYVRDMYVEDEMKQTGITSEKDCISGNPNLIAGVLNTNPQFALEEAAMPEIYKRGIIRICSTENPGISTDPSRFVEVGYCGDEKVKCWLDKNSINDAITDNNLGIRNTTLEKLEKVQKDTLIDGGSALSWGNANVQLDIIKTKVDGLAITKDNYESQKRDIVLIYDEMDDLKERLIFNDQRARLMYLKAKVKEKIANAFFEDKETPVDRDRPSTTTSDLSDREDESGTEDEKPEDEPGSVASTEEETDEDDGAKCYLTYNSSKYENKKTFLYFDDIPTDIYIEGTYIRVKKETTFFFGLIKSDAFERDLELGRVLNKRIKLTPTYNYETHQLNLMGREISDLLKEVNLSNLLNDSVVSDEKCNGRLVIKNEKY